MSESVVTADPEVRGKSILWRYVDLPKLLDLLHAKSLYLRRADGFSDRLEGALFPSLRVTIDEEFEKGNLKTRSSDFYRNAREGSYVCCWTIGARDNMALWQLYGGVKSSVAITTTVDRLVSTVSGWDRSVHLYKVKYIDHSKPPNFVIGAYRDVLQYKSDAYKFENELRVVLPKLDDISQNPMGIKLKLNDINELVSSIIVSPEANDSFVSAVVDLCKKYGLKSPVKRSKLAFIPT
ncbi:hypothetical protein [Marinobacter psychrophilus]|uniref:hypothetical protein n=1 Tax=Marinobacter psychrophilus TaxID=330734 RepID=UPI001B787455|nr:hypothetical protein [Marinobacter psychrophilus]MBQ0764013.1 hypothetical protein [Marinobacter psychrophilus]MBQ0843903.1 hypothetical protein [Marinobacter psychrophilus]